MLNLKTGFLLADHVFEDAGLSLVCTYLSIIVKGNSKSVGFAMCDSRYLLKMFWMRAGIVAQNAYYAYKAGHYGLKFIKYQYQWF